MILVFYLVLNAMAVIAFVRKRKALHVLEMLVYWLLASYLYQNFSALCYMNFKTLIVPDKLSCAFAHFLNRIVLFPLLMVTFLHYYAALHSYLKKLVLVAGFALFMSGLEGLSAITGILIHVHWHAWWSVTYWLTLLVVLVGLMKLFRRILFRGELEL